MKLKIINTPIIGPGLSGYINATTAPKTMLQIPKNTIETVTMPINFIVYLSCLLITIKTESVTDLF